MSSDHPCPPACARARRVRGRMGRAAASLLQAIGARTLAGALCLLAVSTPHAAAQKGVELRYREHEADYVVRIEVAVTTNGDVQRAPPPPPLALHLRVVENDPGEWVGIYRADPGGEGPVDSGSLPMSERGAGASTDLFPTPAYLLLLPLPERPVGPGDTWDVSAAYEVALAQGRTVRIAETTRFRITAVDGERVTVTFDASGSGAVDIERLSGLEVPGRGELDTSRTGSFVFDRAQGRIVRSRSVHEQLTRVITAGPGGEREVVRQATQLTYDIEEARAGP